MSRTAKASLAALVSVTSFVGLSSVAAPSALADDGTYIVAPGDFIKGIAEKLGVTVVQLLDTNDLKFTSVIHPGDEIVVPAGGHLPAPAVAAAGSPAPAAAAATSAGAPTTPYVVRNGDYLFGIAAEHGVTPGALLKANGLKATSTISPGQTLAVPPRTIPLPAEAAPATPASAPAASHSAPTTPYVAQNGDSLFGIAADHGVTPGALLKANGLTITSTITPGQSLAIPPRTIPLPPEPAAAAAPAASSAVDAVLAYLQLQLGKPYKFNTAGPETFDCSGLVRAAFLQVGVRLPHYSLLQSTYGTAVDWTTEPIRAGDLVFTFSSASPQEIGHVGIAIDSRRWIQAAGTGELVRVGNLPKTSNIRAVRRIL